MRFCDPALSEKLGEDIFNWFVNDDGLMHGGYTLRVTRSRMDAVERAKLDTYTFVMQWASIDDLWSERGSGVFLYAFGTV